MTTSPLRPMEDDEVESARAAIALMGNVFAHVLTTPRLRSIVANIATGQRPLIQEEGIQCFKLAAPDHRPLIRLPG